MFQSGATEEKSKDFTDVESQDVIINTDGTEEGEVANEECVYICIELFKIPPIVYRIQFIK